MLLAPRGIFKVEILKSNSFIFRVNFQTNEKTIEKEEKYFIIIGLFSVEKSIYHKDMFFCGHIYHYRTNFMHIWQQVDFSKILLFICMYLKFIATAMVSPTLLHMLSQYRSHFRRAICDFVGKKPMVPQKF